MVGDDMVKDQANCPYFVTLQSRVYRILYNVALSRSLLWLADLSQVLVVVEQRVVSSKVRTVFRLQQLLYSIVVKRED